MTAKHLTVYLLGEGVGTLSQGKGGRHWLTYDEDYTGQELCHCRFQRPPAGGALNA